MGTANKAAVSDVNDCAVNNDDTGIIYDRSHHLPLLCSIVIYIITLCAGKINKERSFSLHFRHSQQFSTGKIVQYFMLNDPRSQWYTNSEGSDVK